MRIRELDFDRKVEREAELSEVPAVIESQSFVWIDVAFTDPAGARELLLDLDLVAREIVDDAVTREPATQIARYDDYLHFVVSGCELLAGELELRRVDVVVGERFLLTVHRGSVTFLEAMRRAYGQDFLRFAQSPSFLIYEIWDHLVENYLDVQQMFEGKVERVQTELMSDTDDDGIFARVADLGADLFHFRKVVLPARALLAELANRRSLYVGQTTQSFLANMAGTLEHVLQDLLVDRDILSEALNLHMSMVSHRTNQVMKKLTVVSVLFLPLTFLCGVYGMNFLHLPELHWKYGYGLFWVVVVVIVVAITWLSKRARLL